VSSVNVLNDIGKDQQERGGTQTNVPCSRGHRETQNFSKQNNNQNKNKTKNQKLQRAKKTTKARGGGGGGGPPGKTNTKQSLFVRRCLPGGPKCGSGPGARGDLRAECGHGRTARLRRAGRAGGRLGRRGKWTAEVARGLGVGRGGGGGPPPSGHSRQPETTSEFPRRKQHQVDVDLIRLSNRVRLERIACPDHFWGQPLDVVESCIGRAYGVGRRPFVQSTSPCRFRDRFGRRRPVRRRSRGAGGCAGRLHRSGASAGGDVPDRVVVRRSRLIDANRLDEPPVPELEGFRAGELDRNRHADACRAAKRRPSCWS